MVFGRATIQPSRSPGNPKALERPGGDQQLVVASPECRRKRPAHFGAAIDLIHQQPGAALRATRTTSSISCWFRTAPVGLLGFVTTIRRVFLLTALCRLVDVQRPSGFAVLAALPPDESHWF